MSRNTVEEIWQRKKGKVKKKIWSQEITLGYNRQYNTIKKKA